MNTGKKIILALLIVSGISLVFAALSIAAFPQWLLIPGGILILFGLTFNIMLDIGSKLSDWRNLFFDEKQKESADKGASRQVQPASINQIINEEKTQITNSTIVAGDKNVIQHIAITFDFLSSLLNFSQEFSRAAAKIANETGVSEKELTKQLEDGIFLNNLQDILASVLKEYQRVEMMDILEELSSILNPIVEKHKKHEREYNYPYGQFCGEFMQAVISSPNIRKAFSTKPLKTIAFNHNLGDHGRTGIKLEVLSKLLPFSKICEGYYFSADINGFESPDSIKKISFSILTPISGKKRPRKIKKDIYHNTWAIAGAFSRRVDFRDRNITFETVVDGYQNFSALELDLQKFSAFVVGLSSDFILISSAVLEHDRQFNEHMKDLFSKLNLDW